MITIILKSYFSTKIRHLYFKLVGRKIFIVWQKRALEKYLDKKMSEVEFYSKKNMSFDKLPIMDKKSFMSNFRKLNVPSISFDDAYALAKKSEENRDFSPKIGNISVGLSSGTSGNSGIFLTNESEQAKWVGSVLAKLRINIFKRQKIAFFLRANNNLYEKSKSRRVDFNFFDIYDFMNVNYKKLVLLNPDILIAQPSILMEIIKKDNGKNIHPKKIVSVAEVLTREDEEKIVKHFNVNVDQIYQAMEGFLGFTCGAGSLHLNEDLVFFEKEWIDKKRFVPVITDFNRETQRMIRYRMNDILHIKDKCVCGLPFVSIEKIEGRMDDVLKFVDSKNLEIKIYPDFIRRAIIKENNIEDYLVEQVGNNSINIHFFKEESMKNIKKASSSINELRIKFDLTFEVVVKKDLNRVKGIKRRRVINLIKK